MRGGLSGGEASPVARAPATRELRGVTCGRCVRCERWFSLATLIEWSDGSWCVGCARAALELERNGPPAQLKSELRAIERDAAAARQRERDEWCGESLVREWSEDE